jgi:hypothetical protein
MIAFTIEFSWVANLKMLPLFPIAVVLSQNEIGNSPGVLLMYWLLFYSSIFIVFMMQKKPLAHKVFCLL